MNSGEASEVRKRVFRLIKNSLVLAFVLVFLNLLRPELASLIGFVAESLAASSELIVDIFAFLFIVYFGYFILLDLKFFLDLASVRFGRKDRGKFQNITYDVAVLISLVLASSLLSPFLASIQDVGETAVKVANIVLLAMGFLVVYHLANQVYSVLKREFRKVAHRNKQSRLDSQNVEDNGDLT
jgi:hypothetical protein